MTQVIAEAPHPLRAQLINVVAFLATVFFNYLAVNLPLNGLRPDEVSALYPTFFTPANFTFSIWGVIYSLLFLFVIYQALPQQRHNERLGRIGWLFVASCVLNCGWIFAFHFRVLWLAELVIVGMLLTLLAIYKDVYTPPHGSLPDRLFLQIPFSVYTGWLIVATVANTSALLYDLGLQGDAANALWTLFAIAIAGAAGYLFFKQRRDIFLLLVVLWALAGIAAKQLNPMPIVGIGAVVAAMVIAFLSLKTFLDRRNPIQPSG